MIFILITGVNSYIGSNIAKWLSSYPDDYQIDMISVRDDSWKYKDFSKYNVIIHTAGIAHRSENKNNSLLYYKVNRDLSYDIAIKARDSGVSQFIFLSSMSVYGIEKGEINKNTTPIPKSHYGRSKLQAEQCILPLHSNTFKVVIIRPPMVYGKGCPGNYNGLVKIAKHSPIFPDIGNQRSMLHINNLSEFLRLVIIHQDSGIFFPQNEEYVNVSLMVKLIAKKYDKEITLFRCFNPIIKVLSHRVQLINKVFGTLVYDIELSNYKKKYNVCTFQESINN